MEKLDVYVVGQAKETNSFIFNLGHKSFIGFILIGNQLCNKVFSICLCYGLRLRIKHIGQVIMILLFGPSDLNERQDIESWGEEDLGASINASHIWKDVIILDFKASKKMLKWAKTMAKIILVSISA